MHALLVKIPWPDALGPFVIRHRFSIAKVLIAGSIVALEACAGSNIYQINLMPAPDVYQEGVIDPFTDRDPIEQIPYSGILYATSRQPAGQDARERYYSNQRGGVLRLGTAQVELSNGPITWEEARRISLLKNRTDKYPLKVTVVEELGILDQSVTVFTDPGLKLAEPGRPAQRFAAKINKKLTRSKHKDIYLYVHGYKVVFENPVLVTAELWHYLGYEGVGIAYAWPATPSRWAYFSDLETTTVGARNLRVFLEYLAKETEAENIHIIGYSAGTGLVMRTLEQLALINRGMDKAEIQRRLRIRHVILVGSDVDRGLLGAYLVDGMLKVPRTLTVYVSEHDKALGLSRWVFTRERVGQMWEGGVL